MCFQWFSAPQLTSIIHPAILSQVLTLRRDDVLKPEDAAAVMRILTNKKAWSILRLSE